MKCGITDSTEAYLKCEFSLFYDSKNNAIFGL